MRESGDRRREISTTSVRLYRYEVNFVSRERLDDPERAVAGLVPHVGNGAEPTPNYTISPGRPQIAGYAAELARQHGLSLAQIATALRERGIADDSIA